MPSVLMTPGPIEVRWFRDHRPPKSEMGVGEWWVREHVNVDGVPGISFYGPFTFEEEADEKIGVRRAWFWSHFTRMSAGLFTALADSHSLHAMGGNAVRAKEAEHAERLKP